MFIHSKKILLSLFCKLILIFYNYFDKIGLIFGSNTEIWSHFVKKGNYVFVINIYSNFRNLSLNTHAYYLQTLI